MYQQGGQYGADIQYIVTELNQVMAGRAVSCLSGVKRRVLALPPKQLVGLQTSHLITLGLSFPIYERWNQSLKCEYSLMQLDAKKIKSLNLKCHLPLKPRHYQLLGLLCNQKQHNGDSCNFKFISLSGANDPWVHSPSSNYVQINFTLKERQ